MSRVKDFYMECWELADAWERLANRADAYGGYNGSGPTTRKKVYKLSWRPLGVALRYHFGFGPPIGLHSTSPDNRCKWLAWDLDSHDGNGGEANMRAACKICRRLKSQGMRGIIFDSDGRGGLHVWCVLPEEVDAACAYGLARTAAENVGVKVEAYPKQPQIREGGFGNWLRVPGGVHPKTGYRSRVRIGERWGTDKETMAALAAMANDKETARPDGRRQVA